MAREARKARWAYTTEPILITELLKEHLLGLLYSSHRLWRWFLTIDIMLVLHFFYIGSELLSTNLFIFFMFFELKSNGLIASFLVWLLMVCV
ncbi:membrane protein [Candidatus Magnetomorum sp. HK-1]|nr:membrane protein [Candidatus Magnetomorum sp. HK-1]